MMNKDLPVASVIQDLRNMSEGIRKRATCEGQAFRPGMVICAVSLSFKLDTFCHREGVLVSCAINENPSLVPLFRRPFPPTILRSVSCTGNLRQDWAMMGSWITLFDAINRNWQVFPIRSATLWPRRPQFSVILTAPLSSTDPLDRPTKEQR